MKNKLHNPVWYALSETQQKWLITLNDVKFYQPEICPFGAFTDSKKTKQAIDEYGKITDKFFLVSENNTPTWNENHFQAKKIEGCQMVLQKLQPLKITEKIIPLTKEHIDEIYDLIWLVMPGYYRKQTFTMGNYFGIFKEQKLIAVSGQRMQTNDFIEISGVVTHPNYTKKGFAGQLVAYTCLDIIQQKKHPILHTTKENTAISLYKKLGFEGTIDMNWWLFNKKKQ